MAGLPARERSATAQVRGFAEASLMVAASTLAGLAMAPRWGSSYVDHLYLHAVLIAGVTEGLGPALFAALASALAYNFFFTAPHLTFRIDNPNDVVTVVVLFAVAVVTSQLAASVRRQARIAEAHAARNATIAGLAR
jgi:two-component system sensor histidine kinase KdpD